MSMDTETLEKMLRALKARVDALDGADAPVEVGGDDTESLADAVSDLDEFRAKYEPMLEQSYAEWIKYLKANKMPLPDGYVEPEHQEHQEQQEPPANPTQAETPPSQ